MSVNANCTGCLLVQTVQDMCLLVQTVQDVLVQTVQDMSVSVNCAGCVC
jgi:hypothetical protein